MLGVAVDIGLRVLFAVPALIRLIQETTEAVEEIGGPGTGPAKRQAVLEAVEAAYRASESMHDAPPMTKDALMDMAGNLVDSVVALKNKRGANA